MLSNNSIDRHRRSFSSLSSPNTDRGTEIKGEDNHAPTGCTLIDDRGNWNGQGLPMATTVIGAETYSLRNVNEMQFANSIPAIKRGLAPWQLKGIENICTKFHIPIGLAAGLLKLSGHRMEFMLDDSGSMSPADIEDMRQRLTVLTEFIAYIPHDGVTIRLLSEPQKACRFTVDERSLEAFMSGFEKKIQSITRHKEVRPALIDTYGESIQEVMSSKQKTAIYIFTSGKFSKESKVFSTASEREAESNKTLVKVITDRPRERMPTTFYAYGAKAATIAQLNLLDQVCPHVNTVGDFKQKKEQFDNKQGEALLRYNWGVYWMSTLLGSVDQFWKRIDKGGFFGPQELMNMCGVPLNQVDYKKYFDYAYSRQSPNEYGVSSSSSLSENQSISSSRGKPLPYVIAINNYKISPRMQQEIAAFRKKLGENSDSLRNQAIEKGIDTICTDYDLPIGAGLRLAKLAEYRLEIIVDDSSSMKESDTGKTLSRMEELKLRLCDLGKFLAYLPHRGIRVRTLNSDETVVHFPREDYVSPKDFIAVFERAIKDIKIKSGTPLIRKYGACVAEAQSAGEKTAVYIFTDGQPADKEYPRQDRIKTMIEQTVKRNAELTPTTFCPCTDNPTPNAWINFADSVCANVNIVRDYDKEKRQIIGKQGSSFPYTPGMHIACTLMGGIDPFFNQINKANFFSREELECLTGLPVTAEDRARYFNEAFELQRKSTDDQKHRPALFHLMWRDKKS